MPTPVDVVALVRALAPVPDPRLTWYGADGERVELSGRVLVNWVAKTANLFLDDLDVRPGETVVVDLPAHWRAPVLWLAAWYVGARVRTGDTLGTDGVADVLVRADEAEGADGSAGAGSSPPDRLLVVALPSLARAAAHLPPGAVDYAADVAGHPDAAPAPGPAAEQAWSPEHLVPGRRLLGPGAGPAELLGTWAAGGSVVWHDGLGADRLDRLVAQERVDG